MPPNQKWTYSGLLWIKNPGAREDRTLGVASTFATTAQWLNILGEGTNNSYVINEFFYCNFWVLDVIFGI